MKILYTALTVAIAVLTFVWYFQLTVPFGGSRLGPASYYPPSAITGVTNPNVTQSNIQKTICVSGWTATIRPPSSYTTALKKKQEAQFNLKSPNGAEEDHYISLELGGNPTDPANLWAEPYPTAHLKDQTENYLHRQVCGGTMTLKEAQREITTDWYAVYVKNIQGKSGSFDSPNDPDDEVDKGVDSIISSSKI